MQHISLSRGSALAALVLGGAVACAGERITSPAVPEAAPQQRLVQAMEVRLASGAIRTFTSTHSITTRPDGGSAAIMKSRGAIGLAAAGGTGGVTRTRFVDKSGARYEMRVIRKRDGSPIDRIELRKNGLRLLATTFEWRPEDGGVRSERQDLYRDGALAIRSTVGVAGGVNAGATRHAQERSPTPVLAASLFDEGMDDWGDDDWWCEDFDDGGGLVVRDEQLQSLELDECGDWDEEGTACESELLAVAAASAALESAQAAVNATLDVEESANQVPSMLLRAYFAAVDRYTGAVSAYLDCRWEQGIL
jgi:hypothetical protein